MDAYYEQRLEIASGRWTQRRPGQEGVKLDVERSRLAVGLNASCEERLMDRYISPAMNDPMKAAPSPASATGRICPIRRVVCAIAVIGLGVGLLSGCAHRDEKKKHKREKHRNPVEQKVFYDGWWPKD